MDVLMNPTCSHAKKMYQKAMNFRLNTGIIINGKLKDNTSIHAV